MIEAPQSFSGFDYPQHLASQGIGSLMRNAQVVEVEDRGGGEAWLRQLHRVRGGAARSLAETLPEPQASLTQALLLGLRGGVPAEVSDAFRRSGTAHLLAISGLHVGVVLALGLGAAHWLLGRRRRAYLLLPLALIWGYALLAGAPPSAVRASLMGTIYLLALATGRSASPLNALAVAALLMLAWQPRWLWHLSFQLSFAAMAGVVLLGLPAWSKLREVLARRAGAGLWGLRLWSGVGGGLLVSAGAVLGTLPLVAFNFHQVLLLGIPTTLVTLPVLPGILLGGLATAVLAALWAPLGWAVGWVPWLLGEYLELVVDGVARVSWSVVEVEELGPALVWGYYSLLGGVMAVLLRGRWLPAAGRVAGALWRGPATPRHRLGVLLAVGLLTGALWVAAFARPDDRLHLYVLDVGQGDAILVRTPGGHNLLVDGGPDPRVTLTAIDQILPYNDRTIDVALLSHAHADHLNGLMAMAERGRLERMVVPPPVAGDDDEALWRGELEDAGLELVQGSAGMTIALPDGVRLEVLHPPLPPNSGPPPM